MFIVLSVRGLASEHAAGRSGSGGFAQFHSDRRRITDEKPPHRLVFGWPEEDGADARVAIDLEAAGDKGKLTLTHSRLDKRETMIGVSGGWRLHLDMLETVLQAGRGGAFWSRVEGLEAEYDERHGGLR